MKKKLVVLLAGFIACYYIIHIAYDLPNLVNGYPQFALLPTQHNALLARVAEMCINSLYVLLPYLLLYIYYPIRKTVFAVLLTIATIVCIFFLEYGLRRVLMQPLRLRNFFNENLFFSGVYILYGIVFYFIRYAWHKEIEQKDLLLQNRQSELSFLRSQINPHFLFNSLNNIYALVYESSPKALPAIAGLSELLRYMLYDNKEKVPLEKELAYIEKYIALQKLRFEHEVKASVEVRGNIGHISIAPLLLVPFIENAFKHGDFSETGEGLKASIHVVGEKVIFYCRNTKGSGTKDAGGGIGLTNIQRRLQLLYPSKHNLDIINEENSFTVNLELTYG